MTMPTYQIFIDGKPKKIELTKNSENTFAVKVDDKPLNVELSADKLDMEKQFSIKINDKTYRIELPEIDREKPFQIKVEEATFKAEVKTPSTTKKTLETFEPTPLTPAKKASTQKQVVEGAITAPMTGKILSVKVKKDDQVKTGQVLCLIEAMKMENEITAPKTGTIQEVNVSDGSSVNEGEILFIIS
jgi:biotin carboxyl carrier protein